MALVRVHNFAVSLDGFGAGPNQDVDNPLGIGGPLLHNWVFDTRQGRAMIGLDGGSEGLDNDFINRRTQGVGATIMGRNMFGPVRGPWGDKEWTGWWGDSPPFHHDVFVLTHHRRDPLVMEGGTTFYFVDGDPSSVLELAIGAAAGKDVVIGGGASTIRQFLNAGLIDEMHMVIVPVLLGQGERLFENGDRAASLYTCEDHIDSAVVTHYTLTRKSSTV